MKEKNRKLIRVWHEGGGGLGFWNFC